MKLRTLLICVLTAITCLTTTDVVTYAAEKNIVAVTEEESVNKEDKADKKVEKEIVKKADKKVEKSAKAEKEDKKSTKKENIEKESKVETKKADKAKKVETKKEVSVEKETEVAKKATKVAKATNVAKKAEKKATKKVATKKKATKKAVKKVTKKQPAKKRAVKRFSSADLKLMSSIIYCEAGVEPYAGKVAVGIVVKNRMESKSFPNTLKGVIYQKYQFGPVRNGSLNRALTAYKNGKFTSSYQKACIRAAKEALNGEKTVSYKGKTMNLSKYLYFSGSVSSPKLKIGTHQFK